MKFEEIIYKNDNDNDAKDIMIKYGDLIKEANEIIRVNVLRNTMYYNKKKQELMYELGNDLGTYPDDAARMPIDEYTIEYIKRPPDGSKAFVFDNKASASDLASMVYELNKESYENYLHKLRNPPLGNYD